MFIHLEAEEQIEAQSVFNVELTKLKESSVSIPLRRDLNIHLMYNQGSSAQPQQSSSSSCTTLISTYPAESMKQSTLNVDKEGHIKVAKEPQKVIKSISFLHAINDSWSSVLGCLSPLI